RPDRRQAAALQAHAGRRCGLLDRQQPRRRRRQDRRPAGRRRGLSAVGREEAPPARAAAAARGDPVSNESEIKAPRRRSLWRRIVLALLCLLAGAVVLVVGTYYVSHNRALSRLSAALRELDESDPGWRLEDLLRSRPDIPPDENSVPRIVAIADALP